MSVKGLVYFQAYYGNATVCCSDYILYFLLHHKLTQANLCKSNRSFSRSCLKLYPSVGHVFKTLFARLTVEENLRRIRLMIAAPSPYRVHGSVRIFTHRMAEQIFKHLSLEEYFHFNVFRRIQRGRWLNVHLLML
jgi:hypothetical protein